MRKLSISLLIVIISGCSSALIADDEQQTTYVHFQNFTPTHGSTDVASGTPSFYYPEPSYTFKNFATPQPQPQTQAQGSDAMITGHDRPSSLPSCPSKI